MSMCHFLAHSTWCPSCFSLSRPVCATQIFFDVWSPTEAWSTFQGLHSWGKSTLPSQQLTVCNHSPAGDGTSCPLNSCWDLVCLDLPRSCACCHTAVRSYALLVLAVRNCTWLLKTKSSQHFQTSVKNKYISESSNPKLSINLALCK